MTLSLDPPQAPPAALLAEARRARNALPAVRLFALLLALALASCFCVVVPAGHRGVLLRFGAVQEEILGEGLHLLVPVVHSVKPISVRVQSLTLHSEAASRDLQDIGFDLALSWHVQAAQVGQVFQRLGEEKAIVATVIEPAIEDGIKAVVSRFTAEQLITERAAVKQALSTLLGQRLAEQDLGLDGIDLLQLEFSSRFRQAVEAKQVAEQDARRAEFEAAKARRLADARVFRAEGEARAQQLLQAGLTPEVLEHEAIERWNGQLPLVVGHEGLQSLDLSRLLRTNRRWNRGSA